MLRRHVSAGAARDVDDDVAAAASLDTAPIARPEPVSFTDAFPRLFSSAYRVAYRLLGDRSNAEDVAAETCARAFSRWRGVREYAEPWCVRVSGNLALDMLRGRARAARRMREPVVQRDDIDTSLDRLDLYRALSALPRRQREVVVVRYLGDQTEEQTATLLGLSLGSVKTHASRGISRLREVMTA